ncbi:hypothetical protein MHU86_12562 [Fragilaria crotonensis]|nr:hypothetical protein MHU86_12562 [Fragilaria crotonensis]
MDPNNRGYPFDSSDRPSRQQAMNVQMAQQALEMEEALYLQRQQELDRDIHVQRYLLQEQLQQEALSKAAASLHASRLYFAGGLGGGGLAAQLQEREFLLQRQEKVRRHNLQQQIMAQTQNTERNPERNAEKRAGESLATNAVRRSSASNASSKKRSFDISETDAVPSNKRTARAAEKAAAKASSAATGKPKISRKKQSPALSSVNAKKRAAALPSKTPPQSHRDETVAVEALADFGDVPSGDQSELIPPTKGTVESLISAADAEEKLVSAAGTMAKFKVTVDCDALDDDDVIYDASEVIDLPNFRSVLPRLPSEPECNVN